MKKLLLAITLLICLTTSAQSYSSYYDHVIKRDRVNNELSEWEQTNLIAIFSGDEKGDVVLYFSSGKVQRYSKTGKIINGVSKDGLKYRYINATNEAKEPVTLQLFDIGVFRIHTQDATYEYQQPTN